MPKEQIFSQIGIYSAQNIFWETQIEKRTYKPGELEQTKENIKQTYIKIDALLNKYNEQK